MNIIEDVKYICNKLDNIQSSIDELSNKLSTLELQEQDLLHLIENSTLKTNQCYRVIKEIRKCRLERRKVKNDMELARTYQTLQYKVMSAEFRGLLRGEFSTENRKFLLTELNKTNSRLNQPYKNRIYTEEEIKEMLGA